MPSLRRLASRLTRAAVVGFATVFASKPRHDQHWSEPPTVLIRREDDEADSGDRDRP